MKVACLRVQFLLPGCSSLKEKRYVLKSLKDRLGNRFNIALCETGFQEKWQRSEMGFVTIATSGKGVDRTLEKVMSFHDREHRIVLIESEKEIF